MKLFKSVLSSIFLFIAAQLLGQSYYIGPGGQDVATAGSNPVAPFATLAYATGFLSPGDTLFVLAGSYGNPTYGVKNFFKPQVDCTVYLNNVNGAPDQYITIKPYQGGNVIFQADGLATILIKNSSYIRVEGFEVYGETERIPLDTALQYQFLYRDADGNWQYRLPPNTPPEDVETANLSSLAGAGISRPTYFNTAGIAVLSSHHIQIVGNVVHHMPGEGIRAFTSDYLWLTDNEVYECSRRSATGVHGMSVYDAKSVDNFEETKIWMLRNQVYQNYNEVYSWSTTKTFITPHIDEGKGITVQRCTASRNWSHGRIRVENNVSFRNGLAGVQINAGERVDVYHNSLYNNSLSTEQTGVGNQHGISAQSESSNLNIRNNIVVTDASLNGGKAINISSNSTNIVLNNNIVVGSLNNNADGIDVNTSFLEPQYTNADGGDLSLEPESPAIDAATTSFSPGEDLFNNPRDENPDLGAIEFQQHLPVTFLDFGYEVLSGKTVLLKWRTAEEIDNAFFTVERSVDGEEWASIGQQVGAGFSAGTNSYSLLDAAPLSGTSFYRLRQTDFDGTFRNSDLLSVLLYQVKAPLLYPNPARKTITIAGQLGKGSPVMVYDALGRVVLQLSSVGSSQTEIDIQGLQPGTYFLRTEERSAVFHKH